jgi:hypothetical protein
MLSSKEPIRAVGALTGVNAAVSRATDEDLAGDRRRIELSRLLGYMEYQACVDY